MYGTGRKIWNLVYRVKGKKTAKTKMLGVFPSVSLAEALSAANEILREESKGIDTEAERQ